MTRFSKRNGLLLTVLLAVTLTSAGLLQGKGKPPKDDPPPPSATEIYRPVIIAYSNQTGVHPDNIDADLNNHPVMMKPDGSGLQLIHCVPYFGDLTHGGGTRYVLDKLYVVVGESLPKTTELVASSEDCLDGNPSWSALLFVEPGIEVDRARWSPDSKRVAFNAFVWATDENGDFLLNEVGNPFIDRGAIFVGEVLFDNQGRPDSLWDGETIDVDGAGNPFPVPNTVREVVAFGREFLFGLVPSWASDSVHLAYSKSGDILVTNADTLAKVNVTNTPDEDEFEPSFSPVAGDFALAFVRAGERTSPFKGPSNDIYVVDFSGDHSVETLITGKSGVDGIRNPEWSPDASQIAFSGGTIGNHAVFRINAAGGSRATRLFNPKNFSAGGPRWRD